MSENADNLASQSGAVGSPRSRFWQSCMCHDWHI